MILMVFFLPTNRWEIILKVHINEGKSFDSSYKKGMSIAIRRAVIMVTKRGYVHFARKIVFIFTSLSYNIRI